MERGSVVLALRKRKQKPCAFENMAFSPSSAKRRDI